MKLIIAGSRGFSDYGLLKEWLDFLLQTVDEEIEIVSGACRGADLLGEQYAREYGYGIKKFLPNWKDEGKGAGFRRNQRMAEYGTHCVLFWDGLSRGTMHMKDLAERFKLPTRVVYFKQPAI